LIDDVRFHFVRFDPGIRYDAAGFLVLMVDAPPLTPSDRGTPFLILDSTWRYLPAMRSSLFGDFRARSLPATVKTAYPRVSKIANDPATGLASVEALYAALRITGERDDSLLDRYHWHREFLESYDRGEL